MSLQSIFPTSLESGTELCDHHYFCCTGRKIEAKIWRKGYEVEETDHYLKLRGFESRNLIDLIEFLLSRKVRDTPKVKYKGPRLFVGKIKVWGNRSL